MSRWTTPQRPGADELAAQHHDLAERLDRAAEAAARRDAAGTRARLEALRAACVAHFEAERRALASLAPHALRAAAVQAHLDSHAEFLEDLDRLRAELLARGPTPLCRLWLGSRLAEWLRFHTRTMDAALAEALAAARSREAAPPARAPAAPR